MKVNSVFESLQGEGKYIGHPALFIRLSGCTRNCDFCDSKYHTNGKEYSKEQIKDIILKSDKKIVVWTGGEPMLQEKDIRKAIANTEDKKHMLETNGDIDDSPYGYGDFEYVSISPKDMETMKQVNMRTINIDYDIKVVTDLNINKELIKYATLLMPLTTYTDKDIEIKRKVWKYCVKNNVKYCPRVHVDIWDKLRGV